MINLFKNHKSPKSNPLVSSKKIYLVRSEAIESQEKEISAVEAASEAQSKEIVDPEGESYE